MKKISVKSLLVLVLVLVLALSVILVACGKKDNNNNTKPNPKPQTIPGAVTDETFFSNLIVVAGGIGREEFKAEDNVAVSLDLEVTLRQLTAKKALVPGTEEFNIGVKLDVILDRSCTKAEPENATTPMERSAENSAARILVYDPTPAEGVEDGTLFAVYFFMDDPTNFYFDLNLSPDIKNMLPENVLSGRYYKVHCDVDSNGNVSWQDWIAEQVYNHEFVVDRKDVMAPDDPDAHHNNTFTIAQLIEEAIGDMGKKDRNGELTWSFNDLVQVFLNAFDFTDVNGVLSTMGLYDTTARKIQLEGISDLASAFLTNVKTVRDENNSDRLIHSADMNIGEVVNGLGEEQVKKLVGEKVMGILGGLNAEISYGELDGYIDEFTAKVDLAINGLVKTNGEFPQVELTIHDLSIHPVKTANIRKAVEFTASNWQGEDVEVLDVNQLLNMLAELKVGLIKNGVETQYQLSLYTDIDPFSVYNGIKAIQEQFEAAQAIEVPENATEDQIEAAEAERAAKYAAAAQALKAIDFEIGFKSEELNAQGGVVGTAIQLLASCPKGELSAIWKGKTYIIDVADIIENYADVEDFANGMLAMLNGEDGAEEGNEGQMAGDDGAGQAVGEDGGFDFNAIIDTIKLILGNVKVNGEQLSLDNIGSLGDMFKNEDGSFNPEFLLKADFTAEDCEKIAKAFGGANANEIEIHLDKRASSVQATATYLNDAGVDAKGNTVQRTYTVKIQAYWDIEHTKLDNLDLEFDLWDDDLGKVVTYKAHLEFAYVISNAGELKSITANMSLIKTPEPAQGQQAVQEYIFDANVNVALNYDANHNLLDSDRISLVVKKNPNDQNDLFHISATLDVTGQVKLLFAKDEKGDRHCTLEAADGASFTLRVEETVVKYIFNNVTDRKDGQEVALKDWEIPGMVLEALKKIHFVSDEVETLTLGQLLGNCNVNVDSANVITLDYACGQAYGGTTETWTLGLNETNEKTMHAKLYVTTQPNDKQEKEIIRVACTYDLGEGENGLAVYPPTWSFECGKSIPAAKKITPPARTGENVNIINSENLVETVMDLIAKLMGGEA